MKETLEFLGKNQLFLSFQSSLDGIQFLFEYMVDFNTTYSIGPYIFNILITRKHSKCTSEHNLYRYISPGAYSYLFGSCSYWLDLCFKNGKLYFFYSLLKRCFKTHSSNNNSFESNTNRFIGFPFYFKSKYRTAITLDTVELL